MTDTPPPTDQGLLMLSAADVHELLDVDTAAASQHTAFVQHAGGRARLAPKVSVAGPADDVTLLYGARLSDTSGTVVKVVSMTPANAGGPVPVINGLAVALDPVTGAPVAVLDGTALTTLRTAAASAVAARALAVEEASSLAVIGSGVQALAHVRALRRVLPLTSVRMWGRDRDRLAAAVAELRADPAPGGGLRLEVLAAGSAEAAVTGATVVALCTTSVTPVLNTAWLAPGTTVISVGSFTHERSEVDPALVTLAAAVVVDDLDTAREHAGPIVRGLRAGAIAESDLVTLGQVLTGARPARSSADDVVLFVSVGIGLQDAAAAWAVVERARSVGGGRTVPR